MKKIEGFANHNQLYPGRSFSFSDLPGSGSRALLIIAEEGEQLPEVMTRNEVQALVVDMYNAAMDGPYIANSEAMRRVATANKFTL